MRHSEAEPTRLVVVLFDGASLGIMSFAFGVFDLAVHYGAMPELDVRVVAGEPEAVMAGDGLSTALLVDQSAIGGLDRAVYADAYATPAAIRAGNAWYLSFHQDIEDQKAYGTITVPMLGIASLASPCLEQTPAARGSDVRVVTVPTSGHFVPEEAPDAVVGALTGLIG